MRQRDDIAGAYDSYSRRTPVPKLHLGTGRHPLRGWLNTDIRPRSPRIVQIDASRPFPFVRNSFEFVYAEHLLEHLTFREGLSLLRESYRVLRPSGTIRVVTPALTFLAQLCSQRKTKTQRAYLRWATRRFIPDASSNDEAFVVNNFFRDWGHQFIYSERLLRQVLLDSGFRRVSRRPISESPHAELSGLENVRRMPAGFLDLESVIFEGTK